VGFIIAGFVRESLNRCAWWSTSGDRGWNTPHCPLRRKGTLQGVFYLCIPYCFQAKMKFIRVLWDPFDSPAARRRDRSRQAPSVPPDVKAPVFCSYDEVKLKIKKIEKNL